MFNLKELDKQSKITKSQITERAARLKEKVDKGEITAPKALLYLKMVEEAIKAAKNEILEDAIDEVDKWEDNAIELYGTRIQAKNGPTRYDYSHIPAWKEKKEELKAIEDLAKKAADSYENSQVGKVAMFSEETGEQIEPAVKKAGKRTLSITIPKE